MASPFSRDGTSREATPSSSSSQSAAMDQATCSSTSMGTSSQSQDAPEMEKFLKRMDMEKTMHALQTRLELASVKATNGWTDMTIGEIETHLPPTPARKRSQISVITEQPAPRSPQIPYEPPSPSRPWQLIDVLWQPLPPPSHSRYPTSPVSPQKRSREDDFSAPLPLPNGHLPGHRRASSSVASPTYLYTDPYPSSPLRHIREGEKKRRSQSHSHHSRETTTQDVDAAKALTSMLSSSSQGSDSSRRRSSMQAPLLPPQGTTSLPLPTSPEQRPPRPRAASVNTTPELLSPRPPSSRPSDLRTPSSHTRSRVNHGAEEADRGEDEQDAAELMMFLAHSPSPMKRFNPSHPSPVRTAGGAARVLFADAGEAGGGAKLAQHSNLAMAPPIIAATKEEGKVGRVLMTGDR